MKIRSVINESNHELYDMLIYYLIDKSGYSPNVKAALNELYKIVLDEINKEERENVCVDLIEIKTFMKEQSEKGKTNIMELDWECFLLNDLLESYFGNKYGCYPSPIAKLLNDLAEETLKHVIKKGKYLEDDAEFTEITREYNYEEDNE